MNKRECGLADLPMEMHQLLVEKSDFLTRCRLRAVSPSLNQLVDSTKLFLPVVQILERFDMAVRVKIVHKLFKDEYKIDFDRNLIGGTRICRSFGKDVILDESKPTEEAFLFVKRMCFQNNVTIGLFDYETIQLENKVSCELEKVIDETNIPLKIRAIHWNEKECSDVMWKLIDRCDGEILKELKVKGKFDNCFFLFGENDEKLKKLERIEVEDISNATNENVLSLNASVISLKSFNFDHELVTALIEKFTEKRLKNSYFMIKNPSIEEFHFLSIPAGFQQVEDVYETNDYFHELVDDDKSTVVLRIDGNCVSLQVNSDGSRSFGDQVFVEPPDDSSEYNDYDDYGEDDYYDNDVDFGYNYNYDPYLEDSDFDDYETDAFY